MQMPERLLPAQDAEIALGTVSKSVALGPVHRNHKTSDCGQSGLHRIEEQCTAGQFPANIL
jgi:hypothetical protein